MDAKSVQVDYSEGKMQIERPGDSGAGRNGEAAVAFRKAMALSLLVVTALFLGKMLVCRHEVTTTPIIWAAPDDLSSFNPAYNESLKFGGGHNGPQVNFTWDITHFKSRAIGGELLYFLSIAREREDGTTDCLRLHSLSLNDHIWAYYTMTTYDEVPQLANVLLRIVNWNDRKQDKIYGPYQCAFMGDDKGVGCHFVILSAMKAFEFVDANGTLSIDIFVTHIA